MTGTPATKPQAVSSAGSRSYAYDCNGTAISRTFGASSYTLTYDPENRMTCVSGAASATFVYDGDGNRVKATVAGVTAVYLGYYYEWNGSAGVRYYYAGGQRVAMRNTAGTLYFLLSDYLGSTTVVADASGNFYGGRTYYPWGTWRYASGTIPTSYAFTGARLDTAITALYYMGSRWYDMWSDRFMSADSIVPGTGPQALNRYSYVFNNPMRYTDPSGHRPCNDPMGTCQGGSGESASSGCQVDCSGDGYNAPSPQLEPQSNGPCLACTPTATSVPPIPTFSIMDLLTPSPTPGQHIKPNNFTIVGKEIVVDPSKIDYVNIIIDVAGIVGDAASATGTPIGASGYELTEIAEGASYLKAAYDYTQNGDPNGLLGVIFNGALDVKFVRLAPVIGFVFDIADIGISVAPAVSVVDVQTQ